MLKEQIKVFANQNKFSLNLDKSRSKNASSKKPIDLSPVSTKKKNQQKIKRTFYLKQGDEHTT